MRSAGKKNGGHQVRAFAPATVGNLACGFDVFGLALQHPGDVVVARERPEPGVSVEAVTGSGGRIPTDPERNTAAVAARALLERVGAHTGVALQVHKGLPLAGGLGGSAASAVAAAVAVDALLDARVSLDVLLECAAEGERAGAGSPHLDNVAAALYGGIVLVRPGAQPAVVQLPVPEGLACAVVHPHLEVETREARRILGDSVRLHDAVTQWGNTAALVAGLFREDWEVMGSALVDVVAEPKRAVLVPGFAAVKGAALAAGALGCSLSGAGPSVFALCRAVDVAERAAEAMRGAFAQAAQLEAEAYVSLVARAGARVLGEGEEL